MRISDWSSDVCSSDLIILARQRPIEIALLARQAELGERRKDPGCQAGTQLRAEEAPILRLAGVAGAGSKLRSEEHTSELQSLMRISYAVFCLKNKILYIQQHTYPTDATKKHTSI